MSLCVAYKIDRTGYLISDSRITVLQKSGSPHTDVAVKISPIHTTIRSPFFSDKEQSTVLYDHTLGFGFAGDFSSHNAIKELLVIILQSIQSIPQFSPLTINNLFEYVAQIYKQRAHKMYCEIAETEGIDFFLCGTCPESSNVIFAKYQTTDTELNFTPDYSTYSKPSDFPLAIGSGADAFNREWNDDASSQSLNKVIKCVLRVIADDNEKLVGGPLQYGECEPDSSFMVKGVIMPMKGIDSTSGNPLYYLGGMNVYALKSNARTNIYLTGRFIDLRALLPTS